jgi:hypothetical protein
MSRYSAILSRRRLVQRGLVAGGASLLALLAWPRERRNCSPESLALIRRAEWHAVPPQLTTGAQGERSLFDPDSNPDGWLVYPEPLAGLLTTIIVHHSALPLRDGPYEIQQLHLKYQGFADIGYHFLIDAGGCLYEGRSLLVRGAHTGGFNTGTVGIALLGNFEMRRPPAVQLDMLKRLIICLKERYALTHLAGHRDFQPGETRCPGRHLAAILPGLAAETGLTFGTAGYAGQEE